MDRKGHHFRHGKVNKAKNMDASCPNQAISKGSYQLLQERVLQIGKE